MAVQKRKGRKNKNGLSRGVQVIVVFWLVFAIVIVCIFLVNAETIKKNFNLFMARLTGNEFLTDETTEESPDGDNPAETIVTITPVPRSPAADTPPASDERPAAVQQTTQTVPDAQSPPTAQTPSASQTPAETQSVPSAQPAVQTRERNIYFTQIDNDGQIFQSRVTRRLPVSESPMVDSLNVMLMGPSADELNRGILNLIPQNTRMLSAIVRGNTAYISFSEDFLFNAFGIEGYIAQLRQIIWTVTEFSNVRDVQILIEGRRLDYLGEGIWIGSPISRQSF